MIRYRSKMAYTLLKKKHNFVRRKLAFGARSGMFNHGAVISLLHYTLLNVKRGKANSCLLAGCSKW